MSGIIDNVLESLESHARDCNLCRAEMECPRREVVIARAAKKLRSADG